MLLTSSTRSMTVPSLSVGTATPTLSAVSVGLPVRAELFSTADLTIPATAVPTKLFTAGPVKDLSVVSRRTSRCGS